MYVYILYNYMIYDYHIVIIINDNDDNNIIIIIIIIILFVMTHVGSCWIRGPAVIRPMICDAV